MRKFNDVDFKASDNRDWSKKDRYANEITGIDTSGLKVGPVYCCADGTLANSIPKDGECFQTGEIHHVNNPDLKLPKADLNEEIILPRGSSEDLGTLQERVLNALLMTEKPMYMSYETPPIL